MERIETSSACSYPQCYKPCHKCDKRLLKAGDRLIVRGRSSEGLCARGRVMRVPFEQVVEFKHPNRFYSVHLQHVTGPLSGVQVYFDVAEARRYKNQLICKCSAYRWPHKKGTGRCPN